MSSDKLGHLAQLHQRGNLSTEEYEDCKLRIERGETRQKKSQSYVSFSDVFSALGQDLTYMMSDPEVIRRKKLAREHAEQQLSSPPAPSSALRGRSQSSYAERRDSTAREWLGGNTPLRDAPETALPADRKMMHAHVVQRRDAMLASASSQSLLGHPSHPLSRTNLQSLDHESPAGRSTDDAALRLAHDRADPSDKGKGFGTFGTFRQAEDPSPAVSYRAPQVPGLADVPSARAGSHMGAGHVPNTVTQTAAKPQGFFSFLVS